MNRSLSLALAFAAVPLAVRGEAPRSAADPEPTDVPRRVELDGQTRLPLELYGGKAVVEATVDGCGPFRFFLDTGAGATVFDRQLAAELGLEELGKTRIGDPADPEGIEADRHRVGRLVLGDATLEEFSVVSFDRSGLYGDGAPRGVLGMPLFRELLLTLDFPEREVRLSREALPPADGVEIVDYLDAEGGIFAVPVRVVGREVEMTVDSGSPSGISFPEAMRAQLPLSGPVREIGRGRTVAGEAIVYGATLDGAVELGGVRLERPEISFFGRLRHGNLGRRFFAPFALSIDQRHRRLRLVRGADPDPELVRFAGTYGERRITAEAGVLWVQRLAGPLGAGPRIALGPVEPGRFALEGQSEVRFEFETNAAGEGIALRVLTPAGVWERSERSPG